MPLTLVQRKKMQQGLILVLIAVLFITATVLWLGYFKKEPASPTGSQGVAGPVPHQVEINFGVLSFPLLQDLDAPAEPVLEPSVKGRNNPFLPF